jgi:hypothetical protein
MKDFLKHLISDNVIGGEVLEQTRDVWDSKTSSYIKSPYFIIRVKKQILWSSYWYWSTLTVGYFVYRPEWDDYSPDSKVLEFKTREEAQAYIDNGYNYQNGLVIHTSSPQRVAVALLNGELELEKYV